MRRIALAAALSATALAVTAAPSAAVVTVGQVAPAIPTPACASPVDRVQPTVATGPSYRAPAGGKITSWSTMAGAAAGSSLKLKVFRPVAGVANNYTVVGQDTARPLTPNVMNTFPVSITVQAGDLVGLNSTVGAPNCSFEATGEQYFRSLATSDTPDGGLVALNDPVTDRRLNISAVLDPANTFTIVKTKKNKKKGFATLTLDVPGPGTLAVSGKGVKRGSETAAQAGDVELRVKSKGNKRSTLNDVGQCTVKPKIVFTPTNGTASNPVKQKVKLKKND